MDQHHQSKKIIISSLNDMQKQAALFVEKMREKKGGGHSTVVALQGDLGSGKTTFVQGCAATLGIREKVLSPTFVIMKSYEIPKGHPWTTFYHIDCYRLRDAKDILDLGWREIVNNTEHLIFIEWSERVQSVLPKETHAIHFSPVSEEKREVTFS